MEIQYLDFYERVKTLLKSKNLTLAETLKNLGISLDSYKSCKRYGNLPRADEVCKLAQVLDTSVEYLVTGAESEVVDTKAEILAALENLIERYK